MKNRMHTRLDYKFLKKMDHFTPLHLSNQKGNEELKYVDDKMMKKLNGKLWAKVLDDEIK